jgi:hypothetical protein
MLLIMIGLLFGLVILLWCLVLAVMHRDAASAGQNGFSTPHREAGPMTHRSHAA